MASGDHRVLHDGSWGLLEGPLGVQGAQKTCRKEIASHLELPRSSKDDVNNPPDAPRRTQEDAKRAPESSQEHLEMEDVELA